MTDKTGGPAFPLTEDYYAPKWAETGMTLRDYFAAKAMRLKFGQTGDTASLVQMAAWCYEMADAMMEARK